MFHGAFRHNLVLFVLALVILITGVVGIMRVAVDYLLYWDATTMAESWAQHVADNVTDIEAIVAGEMPSEESMRFFTRAQAIRYVFGFEIFDLDGSLRFASEGNRVMTVDGSSHSAIARASAVEKRPAVAVKRGQPPIRPENYSEAFVPVIVDGETRAVVAAYIDLTEKNAQFQRTFALAAAALLLTTGIAFAAPCLGWYRRTEEIKFMARHDALTGLANRICFLERLEQSRARLNRDGTPFNVLMLDLDCFKEINDSLGHAAGDTLLKEVARRLLASTRRADMLARLGGDEFAIVQTESRSGFTGDDNNREAAASLARRLLMQFKQPFDLGGHKASVGASIGISLAPADGGELTDLLKKADLALYETKSSGRGAYSFFDPRMMAASDERHQLETDMRLALTRGEFELHYQPIVDAKTREIVAFEALVHWHHPIHGLIPPGRFIGIAEDTGLIGPLGAWEVRQACRDARSWPPHIAVAVNLSAIQFRESDLLDVVPRALADSGLAAERLELEVTEAALLTNEGNTIALLHQLRNVGVSLVLDDFGYSSLQLLRMFAFDKIKIDRLLTQDIGGRDDCASIICAIVGLSRNLGLVAAAGGVETEQQLTLLRAAGVSQTQGDLFGQPTPLAGLELGREADARAHRAQKR
jgi:diguanylate cyclase (GGDEF)-like protein